MARINEPVAGDKSLRLQGESFLRTMTIGSDWTKLRIGILCTVDPVQIVNGGLLMGLSAGALAWENTNLNFIGYHTGGATLFGGTWAYVSPTHHMWPAGACGAAVTKVGTTIATYGDVGQQRAISAVPANRTTFCVDISRGDPNYTVWGIIGNGPYATIDTSGLFLSYLDYEGNPPPVVGAYGTVFSVPYSGSAALDTVLIRWQNTDPGLQIYRIHVTRFY